MSAYFDDVGKISCDLAKAIIAIKYNSLDAPLDSNDSEYDSFLDKLFETNNSAEDIYFSYAENQTSLNDIAKYVFIIGNHKKKVRLLAFMETFFCELGYMKENKLLIWCTKLIAHHLQ